MHCDACYKMYLGDLDFVSFLISQHPILHKCDLFGDLTSSHERFKGIKFASITRSSRNCSSMALFSDIISMSLNPYIKLIAYNMCHRKIFNSLKAERVVDPDTPEKKQLKVFIRACLMNMSTLCVIGVVKCCAKFYLLSSSEIQISHSKRKPSL